MEALANVNEFGFCELQDDELMEVDGGGWGVLIAGAAFAYEVGKDLGEEAYHWFWD